MEHIKDEYIKISFNLLIIESVIIKPKIYLKVIFVEFY